MCLSFSDYFLLLLNYLYRIKLYRNKTSYNRKAGDGAFVDLFYQTVYLYFKQKMHKQEIKFDELCFQRFLSPTACFFILFLNWFLLGGYHSKIC